MPPINVIVFLCRETLTNTLLGKNTDQIRNKDLCSESRYFSDYDSLLWHATPPHPQQKVRARSHVQASCQYQREIPRNVAASPRFARAPASISGYQCQRWIPDAIDRIVIRLFIY